MKCQDCESEYQEEGTRQRIWPKRCPSCETARRAVDSRGPTVIPDYPETRFNVQLGSEIRSRAHEREVVKSIIERSEGRTVPEWH